MIETILVFVRNCMMAVLTAWAGIQMAKPPEPAAEAEAVAAATPVAVRTTQASDHSANCPYHIKMGQDAPNTSAAAGSERDDPNVQPNVLTIR